MALDRTTIIRGPAQVKWADKYFYSQGDIRVSIGHEVFPITNSSFGHVQDRVQQRTATVTFTPVGEWLGLVSGSNPLWPYGSYKSGDAILSRTSDNDLVVQSYSRSDSNTGVKLTLYNAALTKMPDLILSTTKTMAGEATFTSLGKGNPGSGIIAQDTDESFYKIETGQASPSDSFDPNDVITQPYSATWNTSTTSNSPSNTDPVWGDIYTQAGWHVTFDMNLQPVEVDNYGIVDWTVGDVRASARAALIGISEAQAFLAVHPHVKRGTPLDVSNDLVITGSGTAITVKLYAAQARLIPAQYGLTTNRLAEMEFVATRQIYQNAPQPMFLVTGPA